MKENRLEAILKTSIMLSILVTFGGVFSVFLGIFPDVITLFLTFFLMFIKRNFLLNKKIFLFLFFSIVIIFFSGVIVKADLLKYLVTFFRLSTAFFVITSFGNDYKEITKYLTKAIKIVVFLAFINFFITNIFYAYLPEKISTGGYKVKTLFFIFNVLDHAHFNVGALTLYRNQGIFWEPGILQILANILLFCNLIVQKQGINQQKIAIFTLLSTFSTAGFITFSFILLIAFVRDISVKKIIMGIFAMIIFVPFLLQNIQNKFEGEEKGSSALRTYDMLMGMKIALSYPLTGIGINKERYEEEIYKNEIEIDGISLSIQRGNTNSFVSYCLYFGIPITLIIIYLLYNQSLFEKKFYFFVVIFLSLFSEPLHITTFVFLLLFSSLKINRSIAYT